MGGSVHFGFHNTGHNTVPSIKFLNPYETIDWVLLTQVTQQARQVSNEKIINRTIQHRLAITICGLV